MPDRDMRLAAIRAAMDQALAERLAAEARYRRLTQELIEVGAEVRAEMQREDAHMADQENETTAPAAPAEPGTSYHETITDFRRTLIKAHLNWAALEAEHRPVTMAWSDAHRANPDAERPPQIVFDITSAAMMAASYAYVIAAMIKIAQSDIGMDAAELLAGIADDLLMNGDFDSLNADVFEDGEQPGTASTGLEFMIGAPAEAVATDA